MKKVLFILGLLIPCLSQGAAVQWQIDPKNSTLTFTATQNSAPIKGQFSDFHGEIIFDPERLDESKVNMTVETNSAAFSYHELTNAIKMQDWLDVKDFPHATFKTVKITKLSDKNYQASGLLSIRDKSLPTDINFTIENPLQNKMTTKGNLTFKRSLFGVGQGEWADTNEIKDEVKVDFNFALDRK